MKKTQKKLAKKRASWNVDISFGKVKDTDLLFFTRNLALSIKSGLTFFDALTMLTDQATGKLKFVLKKIIPIVQSGQPFYLAISAYPQHFSPLYINLVKTGELSGTLENNLYYLAANLEKARDLKQKIKAALMYPILILVAVLGLGFSIAIFVLPKIVPLFKTLDVELPATTQALLFIADAFSRHGLFIFIGIFGGLFFLMWLFKRNFIKPFTHRFLLMLPVVSTIVKNVNLEMLTHTLSTLLVSGIPLDKSLAITTDATVNRVYRKALSRCINEVQQGNSLTTAFSHYPGIFPPMFQHMIAMGEKTGNLDTILQYLSEFYEQEVNSTMKNLSTIIEPVLLIIIGGLVGTVAMAILGPIYTITGNLRT